MKIKATVLTSFFSGLSLVIAMLVAEPLHAKEWATEKQCTSWQRQLERVNNQLRAGYTAKQGNKLRKRQRELLDKIRRQCR